MLLLGDKLIKPTIENTDIFEDEESNDYRDYEDGDSDDIKINDKILLNHHKMKHAE